MANEPGAISDNPYEVSSGAEGDEEETMAKDAKLAFFRGVHILSNIVIRVIIIETSFKANDVFIGTRDVAYKFGEVRLRSGFFKRRGILRGRHGRVLGRRKGERQRGHALKDSREKGERSREEPHPLFFRNIN
ncbi:hypothetical protein CRG98_029388 [Punica granatum]|uniref:Uncharacterized protein n=1 Tax=Punica granatum TaxID=22663 RepID=A0A2I0J1U6_PUNGR|nr:hypothetical protein CRG98_029388 [Punica granatum]